MQAQVFHNQFQNWFSTFHGSQTNHLGWSFKPLKRPTFNAGRAAVSRVAGAGLTQSVRSVAMSRKELLAIRHHGG
jgi:hypothetical protein